jgi:hypothetical protein
MQRNHVLHFIRVFSSSVNWVCMSWIYISSKFEICFCTEKRKMLHQHEFCNKKNWTRAHIPINKLVFVLPGDALSVVMTS